MFAYLGLRVAWRETSMTDSKRYLFRLVVVHVSREATVAIRGLRTYTSIVPGWTFRDGDISWSVRRKP